MFTTRNKVRMHDTDMAGILYFPRQFRFVHDSLEDFMTSEGFSFYNLFHGGEFIFVIVHCEADYYRSLKVGDEIIIQVNLEKMGTTSFTLTYKIFKTDHTLMGSAKTVHVTLDSKTRTKIPVPDVLKKALQKHLIKEE